VIAVSNEPPARGGATPRPEAADYAVRRSESPGKASLEKFAQTLLARADIAIDPYERAQWEDQAYAVERMVDLGKGVPWRRL
jgi:hypothetical protein